MTPNISRLFSIAAQQDVELTIYKWKSYMDDFSVKLTLYKGKTEIKFEASGPIIEAADEVMKEYDTVITASDTRHLAPAMLEAPASRTIDHDYMAEAAAVVDEDGIVY